MLYPSSISADFSYAWSVRQSAESPQREGGPHTHVCSSGGYVMLECLYSLTEGCIEQLHQIHACKPERKLTFGTSTSAFPSISSALKQQSLFISHRLPLWAPSALASSCLHAMSQRIHMTKGRKGLDDEPSDVTVDVCVRKFCPIIN